MREHKYRAWDKLRKEYLSAGQVLLAILPGARPEHNPIYLDVLKCADDYRERFVLEQFSGLRDKKGNYVYEEDICRDGNGKIGVVKSFGGTREMPNGFGGFEEFGLYTKLQDGSWERFKRTSFVGLEVIGNIHQNPSLLKGAKA